jgi:hypothetical protein
MADVNAVPTGLKELLRYRRGLETRVYNLRVVSPCLELWRVTELPGRDPAALKEADLTSTDEALALLEEIKRSLLAGGWRPVE